MTKIIYIASGDGHCGSTLLDMLLSGHSRVCGLGEVQMLLSDETRERYLSPTYHDRNCSCGAVIESCPVWSQVIQFITNSPDSNLGDRYSCLLNCVKSTLGPDAIISDSSKYIRPLMALVDAVESGSIRGVMKKDVFVIHLLKDVRSSMASCKRREQLGWRRPYRFVRAFYAWCYANLRLRRYLEKSGIRYAAVNYDALCLNGEVVLDDLCKKIGIKFEPRMLDLGSSKGHVGLGNPMRTHEVKSKKVFYDSRWFYANDIQILYHMLPGIRRLNESLNGVLKLRSREPELFEPVPSRDA